MNARRVWVFEGKSFAAGCCPTDRLSTSASFIDFFRLFQPISRAAYSGRNCAESTATLARICGDRGASPPAASLGSERRRRHAQHQRQDDRDCGRLRKALNERAAGLCLHRQVVPSMLPLYQEAFGIFVSHEFPVVSGAVAIVGIFTQVSHKVHFAWRHCRRKPIIVRPSKKRLGWSRGMAAAAIAKPSTNVEKRESYPASLGQAGFDQAERAACLGRANFAFGRS